MGYFEEAMRELDMMDGTLVPEFVQVPDGFYTQRIVTEIGMTQFVPEGTQPTESLKFHYEPCRIPRTRTELVWTRKEDA